MHSCRTSDGPGGCDLLLGRGRRRLSYPVVILQDGADHNAIDTLITTVERCRNRLSAHRDDQGRVRWDPLLIVTECSSARPFTGVDLDAAATTASPVEPYFRWRRRLKGGGDDRHVFALALPAPEECADPP